MKDDTEKSAGAVRKHPEQGPDGLFFGTPFESGGNAWRGPEHPGAAAPKSFDFWVALDILAHRWYWLFLGALLCAAGFAYLGYSFIKPKFTASGQLLRSETPEFFKSTQLTPETFAGLIRSPDLLRKVGDQAKPPIPPDRLLKCIKIDPEPDSDLVKVMLAAPNPQEAVDLLNIYLQESVAFTKELQTEQAAKIVNDYLKQQVAKMNEDISSLHEEFRGKANSALAAKVQEVGGNLTAVATNLNARRSPLVQLQLQRSRERLDKSLLELHDLQVKFTEKHPWVVGKEEEIAQYKKEYNDLLAKTGDTNVDFTTAAVAATRPANTPDPETDIVRIRLLSVEEARVDLERKLLQAQLYQTNPPGMAQIFAPATSKTVQSNMRLVKVALVSVFGGAMGLGLSLALLGLAELNDGRMRSRDDLQRVTRLPLLTTLKDLRGMSAADRAQWAFRTWTILQGRLSPSPNHGLVCGITSSSSGEGRSTWISLLAEAASLTGFRVLTIATRPSPTHAHVDDEVEAEPPAEEHVEPQKSAAGANGASKQPNGMSLQSNVLTSPAKVTEQLTGPNSQPVVHIPLPGWVWNLERRKQWREALSQWRSIDNLVILVELPPASVPEAVLLGSNLPNLVWLADCGTADAGATREQLDILRHARCNLIGTVLNREGSTSFRRRFPRWLGCLALLGALGFCSANAQTARTEPAAGSAGSPPPVAEPAADAQQSLQQPAASGAAEDTLAGSSTNVSFSIVNPAQRAAWQQHLTLGPGDVLSLGLYGAPELAQAEVTVGPDGRVSYLEAQDVLATGLTIDEFRTRLDRELAQYRRAPRTFVSPVAFRSKRYYMLGKVMTKGVYVLDRPITVLEAIARAHGLENGLVDRNVIDLADFQRSFLARGGKRYPLNFEKLFQDGDLSQNIAIEPGDYLYFPSTTVKEVYVVGEVRLPGTVVYSPDLTIIGAISARGGYTDRAYRARVLVVRGSLNNPERFAVDTHAILDGRSRDFQLQPRDIIYVNSRPFIRVEELADLAATAFVQSLITTWVGVDIIKPINQ